MIHVFFCAPDDLASKANIIIDPAEIQATSMDDLDEDEESGAAQVACSAYPHTDNMMIDNNTQRGLCD